ncbi:MAG: alpha/beta fold hydrolase, partial [Candidatus Eremiobacteraeota bacterium]|nr:alpha/beta fold hydrolase [Candidatus Eremiobacteraeota bacterium]
MERDAYTIYGDLSRPPLLLIHGMRLGRQIWDVHARILCDEFCVLTIDLPGHAALTGVPFTTHTVNCAIANLLDSLELAAPPVCVGYSLGGYIINGFAREFPERTSGLVIAGASVDVVGWRAAAYRAIAATATAMPVPLL